MAMKPNYRQERVQRARAKEQKKQEKLRQKLEAVEQRKALRDQEGTDPGPAPAPDGGADEPEKE